MMLIAVTMVKHVFGCEKQPRCVWGLL